MWHLPGILILGMIARIAAGDDVLPPPAKVEASPTSIYFQTPVDRDNLLKWLARPDMVILDGETYARLRQSAPSATKSSSSAIVESVTISGDVSVDWARLAVEYRVALGSDGSTWVPIHLDGLTLAEAREGARDLPTRSTEVRSWQVELVGKGLHTIRVEAIVPVRPAPDGHRLELAIPPAASTKVDLNIPGVVLGASTGAGEPVGLNPIDGGFRLATRVGPRPRLDLAWREPADPTIQLPVLLSAKGEIVVEIESGSIKTQSTWGISAIRGSACELTVRLDPAETVLEVELDHVPVQIEARRDGSRSVITIPLGETLRPGQSRGLVLLTRRPIPVGGPTRLAIQGYPIDHGRVQTGVISMVRNAPVFLSPVAGRAIRRIDPRTDLRDSLRSRPDTAMAFEFNDQPFELAIDLEPAPPRLLIDSRTTAVIAARSAKVETRLEGRFTQGRAFEVQVRMPKGLELDEVGPPEIVASSLVRPSDATSPDSARFLTIVLRRQDRESDAFVLKLKGSCPVDPSTAVSVPFFRPMADRLTGCRVVVLADRNVGVELGEGGDEPPPFRVDGNPVEAGWDWPGGKRPTTEASLLSLSSDINPDAIPLKVTVRSRSIRYDSTATASFDRHWVDVVDEISGEVSFDTLGRIDLGVPSEVPGRIEFEGGVASLLGTDPDGTRRFRVKFPREQSDSFRLRARFRITFAAAIAPERSLVVPVGLIKVLEGVSTGRSIRLSAESGMDLEASGKGWTSATDVSADPPRLGFSTTDDSTGPLLVTVRLAVQATMPKLVAPRLWIRSVQRPDFELSTSATYWVESRDGPIVVALPHGSRWIRARLGRPDSGEVAVEVVTPDEYRLRFPGAPTGPILLTVEYQSPASSGWVGPRLVDGVVQQSAWEVIVTGNRAGVGVPDGWADENEWAWDGLIWRRGPGRSFAELSRWMTGGSPRHRVSDPFDSGERASRQSYLFGRSGPPGSLGFLVVSRILLLLVCSGPVLLAGLLILARRPGGRVIAIGAMVVAFAVIVLLEENAAILVLQSSALGFVLLLGATAMNWAIERRGGVRPAVERPSQFVPIVTGSSHDQPATVGSDDSTAIRPRPANLSTAEHRILERPSESPTPASGLEVR